MERIVSVQNERIKKLVRLHQKKDRDETGLFLAEGEHLIEEALKAGAVEAIYCDRSCPFAFSPVYEVSEPVMRKLCSSVSGAHLIAVCRQRKQAVPDASRVLLLDGVQDPGNLGTIIRTAVSFGYAAVYCSPDTADLYNDKVIRSTQGALFHIAVIRGNLADIMRQLQKEGFLAVATTLDQAQAMNAVVRAPRMAFLFGNEGQGVSPALQKQADVRLRIEMNGFESLNVAVAAGIVMYHFRPNADSAH